MQEDEADMGLTYQELSRFGRLRKIDRCGPVSMFEKLIHEWGHLGRQEVAAKVKYFFYHYSLNRHKMTTLTPSYHAESYSPDDNRFDLRQFLYNVRWTWQFQKMDRLVKKMEDEQTESE
jgi:NAD+ synthase (glutamine-hydrolysing)